MSLALDRDRLGELRESVAGAIREHRKRRRIARARSLVANAAELLRALESFEFHPVVSRGEKTVNIWLPEFEVYGSGPTYAGAKEDLLNEIRTYALEYAKRPSLRKAPNRARHQLYVIRVLLAMEQGLLEEVVFAPPVSEAELVHAASNSC